MPDEKPPFVQEPDTLITAPPVTARKGKQWLVKLVHTTVEVEGQTMPIRDKESGFVGFLPVFDDYEKALSFVQGDSSLIAGIEPAT